MKVFSTCSKVQNLFFAKKLKQNFQSPKIPYQGKISHSTKNKYINKKKKPAGNHDLAANWLFGNITLQLKPLYLDQNRTSTLSFHYLLLFKYWTGEECRSIVFKEPIQDKVLEGYLIRLVEVSQRANCKVLCYTEPNCVSINFGPSLGGNYVCELNNASDESPGSSVLQSKQDYSHFSIEVKWLISDGGQLLCALILLDFVWDWVIFL